MARAIPDAGFEAVPFGCDPWRLVASGEALLLPHVATIFALGNGFVGLRGPGDGAGKPHVYLNGVFEKVPIAYHEAAFGYAQESDLRLSVADATRPNIRIDGVAMGAPVRIELDMRRGVLTESFVVKGIAVQIERLVSMSRSGVIASKISIDCSDAQRVLIEPKVLPPPSPKATFDPSITYDPRVAPPLNESQWIEGQAIETELHCGRVDRLPASGFSVAAVSSTATLITDGDADKLDFAIFAAYAATRDGDPLGDALTALSDAWAAGFASLAVEQSDWFERHWAKSQVKIPDLPAAEQAVRYAQFQLVQAVCRDGKASIAAKGQTGEGYEGHVFWDADLYVLPVFAFTRPEIARAMLVWRIAGLDAARSNARMMGQSQGALYPWRTIDGAECSSFFPGGSAQYHINADIAFALRTYVEATGDRSILDEGGAMMLVETARIWLEIGYHDPAHGDMFVINRVTGPDEYSALVDNNLYTNMMAAAHLDYAAEIGLAAQLIDNDEAVRMRLAATKIYLPFDEAHGIYAQDDGFFNRQLWPFADTPESSYPLLLHFHPLTIYRHQVCKQADAVLAITLLPDRFDAEMRVRMLEAYEAVTVHDSTLSASVFATAAAQLGDVDRAFRYWRVSALTDICDLFGNSDHGLHMAALAGCWTSIAMGFAGMKVEGDSLSFAPITMPALGEYCFRANFRNSLIEISVADSSTSYQLITGASVQIRHYDEAITLSDSVVIPRTLSTSATTVRALAV